MLTITDAGMGIIKRDDFRQEVKDLAKNLKAERVPVDEAIDVLFTYIALVLAADDKGQVAATGDEVTDFVNTNLPFLKVTLTEIIHGVAAQ